MHSNINSKKKVRFVDLCDNFDTKKRCLRHISTNPLLLTVRVKKPLFFKISYLSDKSRFCNDTTYENMKNLFLQTFTTFK